MGCDINFKVKVEGTDKYVPVGNCDAFLTLNVQKMIEISNGMTWPNEGNIGFCKDVIPKIAYAVAEVCKNPERYKPYESGNGFSVVKSIKMFYDGILEDFEDLIKAYGDDIANVTTFWVE